MAQVIAKFEPTYEHDRFMGIPIVWKRDPQEHVLRPSIMIVNKVDGVPTSIHLVKYGDFIVREDNGDMKPITIDVVLG